MSYEILNILINISYKKEGEFLFGSEEKVISNLASFLGNNKSDIEMLYYGIILIKNITYKNPFVKQILQNYNIIEFFNEIYTKFVFNSDFMKNLILCLGHFINSRILNNNILTSIKIIKTQLKPNLPAELLTHYVYILFNLSQYNNKKVHEEMIKNEIQVDLMNVFPFDKENFKEFNSKNKELNNNDSNSIIIDEKDNEKYYLELCTLILQILGKLLSLENTKITENIINSGFCKFLNKVLQSTDIKIIKYAFFCLSNICAGTYGQISKLYDNDTIYEATKIAEYIYDIINNNNKFVNSLITIEFINTFREINYALALIIINSLYERLMPFVRNHNYSVVKILLKGLIIFNENNIGNKNKDLLMYILNAISKLVDYEKKTDDEELVMNGHINFRLFLEQNGFKEILEKIQTNCDEEIADTAERVFDDLFEDNNDNNNINIDDIIDDSYENNHDNDNENDNYCDNDI